MAIINDRRSGVRSILDDVPDGATVTVMERDERPGAPPRTVRASWEHRRVMEDGMQPVPAEAQRPRDYAMLDADSGSGAPEPAAGADPRDWNTRAGLRASRNDFNQQKFLDDLLNSRDTQTVANARRFFGERAAGDEGALGRASGERRTLMEASGEAAKGEAAAAVESIRAGSRDYAADQRLQAELEKSRQRQAELDQRLAAQDARDKARLQLQAARDEERREAREATTRDKRDAVLMRMLDREFELVPGIKGTLRSYMARTRNEDGTPKEGAAVDPVWEDRLNDYMERAETWDLKPESDGKGKGEGGPGVAKAIPGKNLKPESEKAGAADDLVVVQGPSGATATMRREAAEKYLARPGYTLAK